MVSEGQFLYTLFIILFIVACVAFPAILSLGRPPASVKIGGANPDDPIRTLSVGDRVWFRKPVIGMEGWHHNFVNTAEARIDHIGTGILMIKVRNPDGFWQTITASSSDLSHTTLNPQMLEGVPGSTA